MSDEAILFLNDPDRGEIGNPMMREDVDADTACALNPISL